MHPITLARPGRSRIRPSRAHPSRVRLAPLAAGVLVIATLLPASVPLAAADTASIFDSSTVHDIAVTFDQAAYDAMIVAFQETGDKDWIEATVTIDGVTFEDVGMRLKGNSSLMGLRGDRGGFPGGGRNGQTIEGPSASGAPAIPGPGATTGPAETSTETAPPAAESTASPADPTVRGPRGFGDPRGDVSADEPEGLPWLIRLDKYVDDQSLGGVTDIVVRSNRSETSLNEAVALELLEAAGLASQEAAPAGFSVNGSDPELRLIIENPDDAWQAAHFDGDGALYKAEAGGDWSYRGDDPDAYADVFDQEAGDDVADLAPLIGFLEWLNAADDATFAAELAERFDVDTFATYLAMMDVVDNFDDIDGPGNNAYLHWDAATGVFTIVPWDMNLAFGGLGGGFGGGRGRDPGQVMRPDASFDPSQLPEGFPEPPAGFDPSRGGPGGPGGFGRGNVLTEKFHANAELEALYQSKVAELRSQLYGTGLAQEILDRWTSVLTDQAAGLVSAETIAQEAAAIAERFSAS